jgi:hypothetical protein
MDPQPGEWMTIAEVAARCGVVIGTVRNWIERGLLPVERAPVPGAGGRLRVRVRAADVAAFEHWHFWGGPRPPWLGGP